MLKSNKAPSSKRSVVPESSRLFALSILTHSGSITLTVNEGNMVKVLSTNLPVFPRLSWYPSMLIGRLCSEVSGTSILPFQTFLLLTSCSMLTSASPSITEKPGSISVLNSTAISRDFLGASCSVKLTDLTVGKAPLTSKIRLAPLPGMPLLLVNWPSSTDIFTFLSSLEGLVYLTRHSKFEISLKRYLSNLYSEWYGDLLYKDR